MKSVRFMRWVLFSLTVVIYLIIIWAFLDLDSISKGYTITICLPICFLLCFFSLLWNPFFKTRTPFIVLFCIIAFIRYVLLSFLILWHGGYEGLSKVSPTDNNLILAAILMIWELLVISIAINKWSKHIPATKSESRINYVQSQHIYIAFIVCSIIAVLIIPEARQGLSFFNNISNANNSEIGNQLILGIRECFINAKYFLLFVIIIFFEKKRHVNKSNDLIKYLFLLVFAILTIGLHIGINRKRMLIDALATMMLLITLYPQYKKITILSLISAGVSLIAITTIYRGMIDTYWGFFGDYFSLDFFQVYFLGQYNVAIAIEALNWNQNILCLKSFIYEFVRPIFGIGALVKSLNIDNSLSLFDYRMSWGLYGLRTDQILPMIGQGYMYFGLLLSPIISLLFCRIGLYCDALYRNSQRLEITFISSAIGLFMSELMIVNAAILLNILSFRLAIYVPIVGLNLLFSGLLRRGQFNFLNVRL